MISSLLKKVFGSRNDRLIKQYSQIVRQINALEPSISSLSDDELRGKTAAFKQQVANGASLDSILPEAFAVCREGAKRALGMRHFDVQLIGGMVLHFGNIPEMRTGEGKTLVATSAAYLNALSGKGVHVVTVNDYLASRDAAWMGKLYNFLGLSVGVNLSYMGHEEKQQAYAADITYGTNNEYGFDYLRDNMKHSPDERVQRVLNFAIVDEVDSILIDEARTPLIISGQADDNTEMYHRINELIPHLIRQETEEGEGDFWVDEKAHSILMSEQGHEHVETLLVERGLLAAGRSLYEASNITLMHLVNAGLKAHHLYHKDQHYVVQNGEIVIVDEFTGRLMSGRRWSDGIHQSVEAKEGVPIQRESQTLASITFQNYFRLYNKLSGMTGTADTEAFEFQQIYGLETVVIPTNNAIQRKDYLDQVFRTEAEKQQAIIKDIQGCIERKQPVLVGTTSIESSELLSAFLEKAGVPHNVLNAKQHAREADIIAQAGMPAAVTIATNMAGRGTDIVLGGNIEKELEAVRADESLSDAEKETKLAQMKAAWKELHDQVLAAGGLHIIGTERHESRRVDNQLRGRAGRQGDPGSSRFYLSLEDPLMRIFAGDRIAKIMQFLKMPEGEPIEEKMVTRALEGAQRKVEARNFDMRKQLLEYDDVSNDQRKVIYSQRNELLEAANISETITAMREDVISQISYRYIPAESLEELWEVEELERVLASEYLIQAPVREWIKADESIDPESIANKIVEIANAQYGAKIDLVGLESMQQFERSVMLQVIDQRWREHLAALDHLRQGIHLRGYAQKNPKQEYKREAFELFSMMLDGIKEEVTRVLVTVQVSSAEEVESAAEHMLESDDVDNVHYHHADYDEALAEDNAETAQALANAGERIGRNDPCPCGSGKKYKQCHGKLS
ncbi:preprotein translocase subunit SecA [Leeia sp. TBRC 13508]|uniref:Protein translocase subunit SecA n=1 Tax=Leeia speluncae TaxID=2884804 RepID=A0ABS8D5L3_9NEIS|nr:preprotein translocase subunit SecA [Leeia speluncae]MCB6183504.1 preprotein translocase subunit SecA [Leeia speluncae]